MKIIFLGTSHGYPEQGRYCSSTAVVIGSNCYIIDAGAPVFNLMLDRGFSLKDIQGFFITHRHDDHLFGLIAYLSAANCHNSLTGLKTYVYTPVRRLFFKILSPHYTKHWHRRTQYIHYKKGVIFNDGTVKITAIPVLHIPHSYAFLVEAEGKKILFSGDLRNGMPDYPEILYREDIDMLVLEGAHTPLNSDNVIGKVNSSRISNLYINHISPTRNPDEEILAMFSKVKKNIHCVIAHDGMEVEL